MDIHPAIPHIFYLDVKGKIISYDMQTDIAELVHDFGEYGWRTKHFKLFSYEWHQWPCLLQNVKFVLVVIASNNIC